MGNKRISIFILLSLFNCRPSVDQPNFIIFFADDLGYGDLGCYGSTIHRTPNIDQLSEDGILFTDYYAGSSVCTPSRAALLTGCYPQRIDMHVNEKPETEFRAVLGPMSPKGINPEETTIAEMLKQQGYKTACIGKWHLGDQVPFFPTNHGFDYFYGILESHNQGIDECPLAILEQQDVVEYPVNYTKLTKNLTEKAINFILEHKKDPFFLYLPHPMPHFPVAASEQFKGRSMDGIYGDAIEELDWSLGEIIKILKDQGLQNNTLVVVSSDNGGEARRGVNKGGLNWPLRGHKGQLWEGGIRVPCMMKWPSMIPSGSISSALVTSMDLLPTFANFAGIEIHAGQVIDGKDISNILFEPEKDQIGHDLFFYYDRDQLQAVRWKNWKLHLEQPYGRYGAAWENALSPFDGPQLYNLDSDITETYNIAPNHPEVVEKMNQFADSIRYLLGDYHLSGKAFRKAGWINNPKCYTKF